jgi:hypothetical protein
VAHGRVSLRRLRGTALAIIPARCDCAKAIGRLLAQVTASGITLYLVGGRGSLPELNGLAPARTRGTAMLAIDARNTLSTAYRPSGLMILFVDSHGNVVNRLPRAFSPGRG